MGRRLYIETYGCQMNVADSELIAGALSAHGYRTVDCVEEADVVLLNTCAIREKAEDRIFGRLGWLKRLKEERPQVVLGVTGCMAAHLRDAIVERAPYVDLVLGPDAYRRLPQLIDRSLQEETDPLIDVRLDREELYEGINPQWKPAANGWITIMRGCDKFCTFCVVPYVRGRERSVSPDEIVTQAQQMVRQGFREITLLGQTVSSYRVQGCNFAQLLSRVHRVAGLERIRFTSPYPTDFDDELLSTLKQLPKVARHLHLPVQSGSTRVLKQMRREYTAEQYLQLVEKIQRDMPEFALTTDVIVGFPGETEADFKQTLNLMRTVRFDNAFTFKYSERQMTRAARSLPDTVPAQVKDQRLQQLLAVQNEASMQRFHAMIGRTETLLIEGENPRNPAQRRGRTSCFKLAMLDGDYPAGTFVPATIFAASTRTLFAEAWH